MALILLLTDAKGKQHATETLESGNLFEFCLCIDSRA